MLQLMAGFSTNTVLAASAITWTPVTFYVAMGIIHTIVVLLGYRILEIDAEHNSFVGAVLAAIAINVIGYFVRDVGVVGIMMSGATIFGMLVLVSSGEALKALGMSFVIFASYGLVGSFIVERTPLTIDDIAGVPRMVTTGGLEAEPITEEDHKRLEATGAVD